ncbi:MAG: hypothetical protein Q9227_004060 [Pyrenula ochraceoflavens]
MGQNPTSGLLSVKRRKEVYSVCQKYDVIIVEDDPYWYLQYPSANALSTKYRGKPISSNYHTVGHNYNAGKKTSGYAFLDSLVPSYISMDVDGRVVRLDTFSKTVAPGCRLGWITAQPMIVERILRATETSTQQPSGFVQSMIAELIMGPQDPHDGGKGGAKDGSGWNVDGWVRWLQGLRGNYERRMQTMSSILEDGKYLIRQSRCRNVSTDSDSETDDFQVVSKSKMFDFEYPMAGMFLWMRIFIDTHPLYHKVDSERLAHALWVYMTLPPCLTLITPGTVFSPTEAIARAKGWQYFRICFAAIDEDLLEKKTKAILTAFKRFWEIKKVDDIDEILKDEDDGNNPPPMHASEFTNMGMIDGGMGHFC